ncbi:MAG: glycosyltransferase [Candidatus Paceibacterota bacterium]
MDEFQQKVSIILPTYKNTQYLRQAIDSCLEQTYTNLELIIINDGQSEEIENIVKSYTDQRIHYIKNAHNLGIAGALNTGFSASRGDLLTWTSDDNWFDPEAIKTMALALQKNPLTSFTYCDYFNVDEKGKIIKKISVGSYDKLQAVNCIGACFLYKREIYEKIGNYKKELFLAEDYDYWLRVANNFKILPIHIPLYYYRVHAQSLKGQNKTLQVEIQAAKAAIQNHAPKWALFVHEGKILLKEGKPWQAAMKFAHCLALNPFSAYTWQWFFLAKVSILFPKITSKWTK